MEDIQEIIPVTKAKRDLLDLLKRMEKDQSTIALTRNGEPVCVVMTPARYESLLETIEILADTDVMKALKMSQQDFDQGRIFHDGDVWD